MSAILVSACLLGIRCRYDGAAKPNPAVITYFATTGITPVPVCPEQLGGLPTPRPKAQFLQGDGSDILLGNGVLVNEDGAFAEEAFLLGARMTLEIAEACGARQAILKEHSPSCGLHSITRNNTRMPGIGVTAALLTREGFTLMSDETFTPTDS